MPYLLEQMLTVRVHRENRALNRLVQSKASLAEARREKRRKEQELSDYSQWRRVEEQRLFEHLKSASTTVNDLLHFADTVDSLRQDQSNRALQVDDASRHVIKAEGALDSARHDHIRASRNKMKIETHKEIWMEEANLRAEQAADQESDELGQIPLQN